MTTDFPYVYLFIFIILLFLFLFDKTFKLNQNFKLFLFIISWMFLAVFAGTRVCVGGDWLGYGDLFKSQENIEFNFFSDDPTEVIFRFIAFSTSYLGLSFEVFNLIVSCITCYFLSRGIWNLCRNYAFLLTVLYFSVIYFNQQFLIIRTGLAVSIFIYSISYLQNKRIKFIGLNILSYNIHNTSAIPSFISLLLNRKIDKSIFLSILFAGCFFLFRSDLILSILMGFLEIFGIKYLNYAYSDVGYFEKGEITNTTFMTIVFFLIYIRSKVVLPPFYVNMTVIFILLNLVFPYQGILSRFNAFMLIPVWIFIVKAMEQYSKPLQLFSVFVLIVYSYMALSLVFFDPDLALFRNYNTWLFDFNLTFDECSTEFQY
uniref:EpsG family protein n=1 Tax=Bacteroidota TaxID=976 RepID=UPI0040489B25